MSEAPLNVPTKIDLIGQQLVEVHDIETVKEIKDRAETLRAYCSFAGSVLPVTL